MYVYVEGYFSNAEEKEVGFEADLDQTDVAIGAVYYF
jgi:hypothetical protein